MKQENIEHLVAHPKKRRHQTPLFFQHGAWHNAACWRQFMDHLLDQGYEVHAISLPGHGKSSLRRGHINLYGWKDYLDCLSQEVDKISPAPVLVGHSMGGYLAQRYLESRELPAAVLLASASTWWAAYQTWLKTLFAYPWWMFQTMLTQVNPPPGPGLARDLLLSKETLVNHEEFFAHLVPEPLGLFDGFASVDYNRITTPALVIAAGNDALISLGEQRDLALSLRAKFLVMPGQAHNLMVEPAWQDTADAIHHWVSEELGLP